MVYANNLQELASSTVYLHQDVAEALLPTTQQLHKAAGVRREIWIQPIEIDSRTLDKLAK
ncbi:MAG TPA: hypothetical protein VL306_00485 [Methylomirabilota bacterium]|jgi:hypothetical protein|nr:hypothetical protein [Methylomirabilota bacterium]